LNWLEEKEGKTRTMDTKHFIVELQNFKISYYCWWWGKELSLRPLGYKTKGIIAIFINYINMLKPLMSFKITYFIPQYTIIRYFPKFATRILPEDSSLVSMDSVQIK